MPTFGAFRTPGASDLENAILFALQTIMQAETRPLDPSSINGGPLGLTITTFDYQEFLQSTTYPGRKIYLRIEARNHDVFFRQGAVNIQTGGFSATSVGVDSMMSIPAGSHEDIELTAEWPVVYCCGASDTDVATVVMCISSPNDDYINQALGNK